MSILGGALSTFGGMLGAGAGNRAGRQARDWYERRTREGMGRGALPVFGFDPFWDLYDATRYDWRDNPGAARAAFGRFEDAIGGPLLGQLRALGDRFSGRGAGLMDAQRAGFAGLNALGNRDLAEAARLGGAMENTAQQYGAGAEQLIDEDMARARRGADRAAVAALTSRGLGNSTLLGNQIAGNALEAGRTGARLKSDVRREATDRTLQAQGANLAGQMGVRGRNFGSLFGQVGANTALGERNLQRDLGLAMGPLDLIQATLGAQQMNPWLGMSTSQFYPGMSVAGTGLMGAGNMLGQRAGMQQGLAAWGQNPNQFGWNWF